MTFNDDYLAARSNIYLFCRMLRYEPTEQQRELIDIVQQESTMSLDARKKRIAVKSGQGPGKTKVGGVVMAWRTMRQKMGLGMVTAPTQRQVRDIFMGELRRTFRNAVPELQRLVQIDNFKMNVMGEKDWGIKAVTSTKSENVQGYHEQQLTFLLEEASGVARDIWQTIYGTLTNRDSLLLAIGNPNDIDSAFYDCFFQSAEMWHRLTWNAEDSPDWLVDKTNLKRIERDFGRESDVYRVRVLGEFPRADPTCVISAEDVHYCSKLRMDVLARQPLGRATNQRQIGIDLARYGGDESVVCARSGSAVVAFKTFLKWEPKAVVHAAFALQQDLHWRDDDVLYVFDAGGIGQGVAVEFHEAKKQVLEFHSNGTPWDAVAYKDKITEAWFGLRRHFQEREICVPRDARLAHQLSTRKYSAKGGKLKIESKEDYKERIGTDEATSPDRADGLALAFYENGMASVQHAGGAQASPVRMVTGMRTGRIGR